MPGRSIEARLEAAQAAIDGALADPTLLALLSTAGCGAEHLRAGKTLRENALALKQQQKTAYAALKAATKACAIAQARAEADYQRCAAIARFALRDDQPSLERLDLVSARKRTKVKWLAQMRQFYSGMLGEDEMLERLETHELSEEMLQAGARLMDALEASNTTRRQCKGAAQRATKTRDDALAAMDRWMRSFRTIARTALEDQPQLLANLGMSTRQ